MLLSIIKFRLHGLSYPDQSGLESELLNPCSTGGLESGLDGWIESRLDSPLMLAAPLKKIHF